MKIICWNVNGIRAVLRKGFLDFIEKEDPDIICLQETKIQEHQLTQEMLNPLGYFSIYSSAERPGYSGVATFSKVKAKSFQKELQNGKHDDEGRMIISEHEGFTLINTYIPNGGRGDHRIEYKLDYYDEMLDLLEKRRAAGENLIICGDFNTAHNEIDLARPKQNVGNTGFLPVERAWLDKFTAAGYVDVWRQMNPDIPEVYTWWSYRGGARYRNVGWRIDYFFVNEEFLDSVKNAKVLMDVQGSDHCPLMLEL